MILGKLHQGLNGIGPLCKIMQVPCYFFKNIFGIKPEINFIRNTECCALFKYLAGYLLAESPVSAVFAQ